MPLHHNFSTIFPLLFLATINGGIAQAQIIPDGTLSTEVQQSGNMRNITGGKTVGGNLFHSFDQFSVPPGTEAIFKNALDIKNIFGRITGDQLSLIEGTIRTVGAANLFLLNPNGIIFGANASLDIGGSFFATTANNIEFEDGTSFGLDTGHPNVTLTMTTPAKFHFYGDNGSITVNGMGNQIISTSSPVKFSETPSGISTNEGQTLALVGNGVILNGGVISTEGGEIYLTSIDSGSVGINQAENKLTLTHENVIDYQDIDLNQSSLLYSFDKGDGTISLMGKNIDIIDGSFVLSQNPSTISGGSLNVNASESITLSGKSSENNIFSSIRSDTLGTNTGKGANINIYTNRLLLLDAARIQTSTSNNAMGGNINVEVFDSIQLNNASFSSTAFSGGDAGNIELYASQLKIINSGGVTSSTFGNGEGNGGDLNINTNLIEVVGGSKLDRSSISSSSFNGGSAGNLTINTEQLRAMEGASISSSSFNTGNAGSLTINASESIEVFGKNENLQTSSNRSSTIRSAVQTASPQARKVFGLPEVPTGNAGSLTINTPLVNVFQEGVITVENQGSGSAGTLTINTETLNLDESGGITAGAESGLGGNIELNTTNSNITNDSFITATAGDNENGGNITIKTTNLNVKKNSRIAASSLRGDGGNVGINANDSVSLNDGSDITAASSLGNGGNITIETDRLQNENNSNISASAGGTGDGGNINITGGNIFVLNNSNIFANAVEGNGGNINITAVGLFVSPDSTISATSEFGSDGEVNITNLSDDITSKLVIIDPYRIDLDTAIATTCLSGNRGTTSLTEASTGGFQKNQNTEHRNFGSSYQRINTVPETNIDKEENETRSKKTSTRANRWIRTKDGKIHLIASLESARHLICNAENQ